MLNVRTLIGVITGTKRDKYEDQIAWIRPLAEAINGAWKAIPSPETEFPSRGSIFWPRATGAKENALIRFNARENNVKNDFPDEYMAVDSQLAFEVIDLRTVGDCEQVRVALTNGILLPHAFSPKFLIRCAGGFVVGPVTLVPDSVGLSTVEKNNCLPSKLTAEARIEGRSVPKCRASVCRSVWARSSVETYSQLNAYFATTPGNHARNLRKLYLLSTNYADLSFLFMTLAGEKRNTYLNTGYLAVLETDNATPYFLNPHNGEVPHTLILGMTGSGKTIGPRPLGGSVQALIRSGVPVESTQLHVSPCLIKHFGGT